jgi:hypothetical protein
MKKISFGENKLSAFDLANEFRNFELGSDYKDRIYERVADSLSKWVKSESFRYEIYSRLRNFLRDMLENKGHYFSIGHYIFCIE